MSTNTLTNGIKQQDTRAGSDGPAQRAYDNTTLIDAMKGKVDAITAPITVADATERKALTGTVGVTRVIQADLIGILWTLVAADETLDASWIGLPYTTDPDGDVVVNMQLANVAGTVPDLNVMGQVSNVPTIGDGLATGGNKVVMRYDLPSIPGYVSMTSVKASTISITVKHDGTESATGICYSVNGGTPVYSAVAADTSKGLSIPDNDGAPVDIYIWSATSAGSGKKGELTYLSCDNDSLTSLDVSGCTAMTDLRCGTNSLTSLDVSGCTAMTVLYCYNNSLTSLDVSGCTALTDLRCYNNSLTSLGVSGCTAMIYLFCSSNSLPSLDVSGLTAMIYLSCGNNSLTSLDVSGCTAMEILSCDNNSLTSFDLAGLNVFSLLGLSGSPITSLTGFENIEALGGYGIRLQDMLLDAAALNSLYTQLKDPGGGGSILVKGNPGLAGDDPTIATAKGWVVDESTTPSF